jgi:hypothetical protein
MVIYYVNGKMYFVALKFVYTYLYTMIPNIIKYFFL